MKSSTTLEVTGRKTLVAIALALGALPALAAETAVQQDGHAYVRASILNTWKPTAVASATEGKMDAHERGRVTIVGASKPAAGAVAVSDERTPKFDGHAQARRLLLAQPGDSQRSVAGSGS